MSEGTGSVRPVRVGVLALQGNVVEHERALRRLGAEPVRVKQPAQLDQLDGLVIPGGESPTILKLLHSSGLHDAVREWAGQGMPVFGTCAGLILIARDTGDAGVPGYGLLDVAVARNAYGRQAQSFECAMPQHVFGDEPLEAVFIRAPGIRELAPEVEVLATWDERPVAVRQGVVYGAAFHPELTDDLRLYEAFLDTVREHARGARPGQDPPSDTTTPRESAA